MVRAWADVSLDAVRANIATLRATVAPAEVCAVVKADGYGHGALPVARAALEAGASCLAVAQVSEAVPLRDGGVEAPILLLSEPRPDEVSDAIAQDLEVTVYSLDMIEALARGAKEVGATVAVHLKVDTGMHRVGLAPPDVVAAAQAVVEHRSLGLRSVWTHCAVADEVDNQETSRQLARYDAVLAELGAAGIEVAIRHAANSAAAICQPDARYDLVRCGIAVYGIPPAPALTGLVPLEPAVRLATEVSFVKTLAAGEGISYGHRHHLTRDSVVATLPIGYADGVPRRLGLLGQEVLIGGVRYPMVGAITMDQLMVDLGPGSTVRRGDEAVLLGSQGDELIAPDEWAARLDTIAYEVVCAIGARVERRYPPAASRTATVP